MFQKTVLVSLVIFSVQFVQASQQLATPMPSSSAVCPSAPMKVEHPGRRFVAGFGDRVYPRWQMHEWADHNPGKVPSVSGKLRARAVALAIANSNEVLAYPAK